MKIEKQVLSREQMAHLKELGVDTSDASMAYYNISRDNQPDKWILGIANKEVASIMLSNGITEMEPTYTINDLIEKLPKRNDKGSCFNISLGDKFFSYVHADVFVYYGEYNNLIDGLYNCLCWVAENHKELIIT